VTMSDDDRREILKLEYKTAFDAWRQMVDIRFKLLALIPIATVVGVSQILPPGACAAGIVFVAGLATYEVRNTQIHDTLAKRLVQLERLISEELAPSDVARVRTFTGRPPGTLRGFGFFRIWHNRSIGIIYGTAAAAWMWRFATSWTIDLPYVPKGNVWSAVGSIILGVVLYIEIVRQSNKGRRTALDVAERA